MPFYKSNERALEVLEYLQGSNTIEDCVEIACTRLQNPPAQESIPEFFNLIAALADNGHHEQAIKVLKALSQQKPDLINEYRYDRYLVGKTKNGSEAEQLAVVTGLKDTKLKGYIILQCLTHGINSNFESVRAAAIEALDQGFINANVIYTREDIKNFLTECLHSEHAEIRQIAVTHTGTSFLATKGPRIPNNIFPSDGNEEIESILRGAFGYARNHPYVGSAAMDILAQNRDKIHPTIFEDLLVSSAQVPDESTQLKVLALYKTIRQEKASATRKAAFNQFVPDSRPLQEFDDLDIPQTILRTNPSGEVRTQAEAALEIARTQSPNDDLYPPRPRGWSASPPATSGGSRPPIPV